ncbi:MAG: hypothetical protein ACRC1H_02135 [Caldilineaceae bacterium]
MRNPVKAQLMAALLLIAVITLAACRPRSTGYEEVGHCAVGDLGLLMDDNWTVIATKPGSTAADVGVQVGDRVLSLNDVLFDSQIDTINEILLELSPCEARKRIALATQTPMATLATATPIFLTATLVINRAGVELAFTVDLANEPYSEFGKHGYFGPGDSYWATVTPMPEGVQYSF